jgi:hypothetical protein
MWQLISECIGGVPRTLLWDNESGIGQRGRLAVGVGGFCGVLGTRLIQARPYDPETKGLVERANGYLGSSFLPGRTFCSPADFNAQLLAWLTMVANLRKHATTRVIPGPSVDRGPRSDGAVAARGSEHRHHGDNAVGPRLLRQPRRQCVLGASDVS